MLQHGVDIYSAIEIADNAGRTPLFESCENMLDDFETTSAVEIIKILTRSKQENGFGAKVNILNYAGQTPMFSAAREGNLGAVKTLLEAGGNPNLNNGELVKQEDEDPQAESEHESLEERYFMEAFKHCMTPLHVASVLGYEEIALYLIENGADVNLKTKMLGYSALHLAVLGNKPELLMEILTKTAADPMIEDNQGRALLDMVYHYIPSYLEPF
jgi:ankyrin repeat protein